MIDAEQRFDDALSLDTRARQLAKEITNWYVDVGLICCQVEDRELWAALHDDQGKHYKSFGDWIMQVFGEESKSSAYDARNSIRATKDNVPEAELRQMKRTNIKTLAQLSPAVQQRDDIRKAALTKSKRDFVGMIENDFPGQHVEVESPLYLKLVKKQKWEVDEAVKNCRRVNDVPDMPAEDCITEICREYNQQVTETEDKSSPILERVQ